jgi:hypothetical protein
MAREEDLQLCSVGSGVAALRANLKMIMSALLRLRRRSIGMRRSCGGLDARVPEAVYAQLVTTCATGMLFPSELEDAVRVVLGRVH